MRNISLVKEFNDNKNALPIKDKLSTKAIENKNEVLKYLNSFKPFCVAGMSLKDEITGETINLSVNGYEDGEFVWDTREIYHFEKYDLQLEEEFIQHALSR